MAKETDETAAAVHDLNVGREFSRVLLESLVDLTSRQAVIAFGFVLADLEHMFPMPGGLADHFALVENVARFAESERKGATSYVEVTAAEKMN